MPLNLTGKTSGFKVPITLNPSDDQGNPRSIEPGSLTVTPTSGGGTAQVVDDGNFFVLAEQVAGATDYLVQGDADLGAGVVPISDTIHYEYAPTQAKNLGLSAGDEVPQ